jgi:hypothetical protein
MSRSPLPKGSLRSHKWKRFLRGPDPALVEELYVPALGEAITYDRCCAYFSSSVLSAAARGFGKLIERLEAAPERTKGPAVRLLVNEEMTKDDVKALMETGDLATLEAQLLRRFKTPTDALERNRLGMLAWLYKGGLLDIRVGVMRSGEGIVHAKFGIITDEQKDALVFGGSGNETAPGLLANYERLDVSTSWDDPERLEEYTDEFERLWSDSHPDVQTVSLPEALRQKLLKFAPKEAPIVEPSNLLARQKAAMIWRFVAESPYLANGEATCDATAMVKMWPHQKAVVEETARAWPNGRLLCDEVGMGKTIEAIMVLRRLMAGRGVKRVLILLPKGLLKQWQSELREKGGLIFPRLEGQTTIIWPDDSTEKVEGLREALNRYSTLILSRETARTENNFQHLLSADPWDLVVLDEAHAARRKEQSEEGFNSATLLLSLLRQLQLRGRVKGFLLMSATPMQTHPWEPWDLLSVLGEGGKWLVSFSDIREYYQVIAALRDGRCDLRTARKAAALIAADPDFPVRPDGNKAGEDVDSISRYIAFAPSDKRQEIAAWLRSGSPLARRMHRNTRNTLHRYYERGMLSRRPPTRDVDDVFFSYPDLSPERNLYNSVTSYIDHRYEELEREKTGKGFVMTIYRRRASSSPFALQRSLKRRLEALSLIADSRAADKFVSDYDVPEDLVVDDLPDDEISGAFSLGIPDDARLAAAEVVQIRQLLVLLDSLAGCDTKRDRFFDQLRGIADDGRPVLVFTEYADTLEYLRDSLVAHYGETLGCYSGSGGQLWDGNNWEKVSKDRITLALASKKLRVLLCTDAASEGLNLQTAGAVINYDLPWNPSKVEQRIGRIDRIGQAYSEVRVVNILLTNSVDDRVYSILRTRCGLFEHFVGKMQPVLATAKKILLENRKDLSPLDEAAALIENDNLADEIYVENDVIREDYVEPPLTLAEIEDALTYLTNDAGVTVKADKSGKFWSISTSGFAKQVMSFDSIQLEKDTTAIPLTPLSPQLFKLANSLAKSVGRLPLVVGTQKIDGFRSSVAYWISGKDVCPIFTYSELKAKIDAWDGTPADPSVLVSVTQRAQEEASKSTRNAQTNSNSAAHYSLWRQKAAAKFRLKRELSRVVMSIADKSSDLDNGLDALIRRDTSIGQKVRQCIDVLGEYPEWDDQDRWEADHYAQSASENQRMGRRTGRELDAALADPRLVGMHE